MAAPAPDDDTALARRAADGDRAAFAELVRRYGARLVGFLRTAGRLSPHAAEDAAQDAWLKAWRALPIWTDGPFRAWLFHIARNTARDHAEKAARRAAAPLAAAGDPAGRDHPPDAHAAAAEQAARLAGCRDRLPPDLRAAFDGFVGGEADDDLAAAAAVDAGTIRSRRSKARKLLRACLGVEDE